MAMPIKAASFVEGEAGKVPVNITYKDISRLAEIASKERNKNAVIVNATQYKGKNSTWIVRLNFGDESDQCDGDFAINFFPYAYDKNKKMVTSLPFKDKNEGTTIFGPCWYYFGIFDEKTHDLCGFAVAERIKRWPWWYDQSYFGKTYTGVFYDGDYIEPCDKDFITKHIG